ncbi:MAG: glucosaminidase domain-containing protein [Maribacter sp.]|nr:glucosaminidase domain-containing protein [Maribacter sp.]
MIRRILVLLVLGSFLLACKAKKSVVNTPRERPKAEVVSAKPKIIKYEGDGLHPLPEDDGRFIKFEGSSISEYIDTFSEVAQFEMKAYGIPASITIAQGLLESGFGNGELAKKTNNHFGIKCHTGWNGDYDYHDDDEAGECFRKYNHPRYSFRDHSIFLSNRSRYASLFELPNDDYRAWAYGLQKAGYATDKRYPQKLTQLIETYNLHRYDTELVRTAYRKEPTEKVAENYTYVVQKGDTLYSISRSYSVSVDDLKRWNYIYDNHITEGQQLTVKSAKFNK